VKVSASKWQSKRVSCPGKKLADPDSKLESLHAPRRGGLAVVGPFSVQFELPLKGLDSDAVALDRLSNSPYLLGVADSILGNMDREALADLLASYLYLSSKGMANPRTLATYALSRRPSECVAIAAGVTPALLAGILVDSNLRSAILATLRRWIRGQRTPSP